MKIRDLSGNIYGRWTVLQRIEGTRPAVWRCICACGKERNIPASNLLLGSSKSCGCYKADRPRLSKEELKRRRALAASAKDKTPIRKEEKRLAQMRYTASPKAILAAFHRWAKKRANCLEITDSELLSLRDTPCHRCGRLIEGIGNSFILKEPRKPIALSNMVSTCGVCKLIKPKEDFNAIAFAKRMIRRVWKRTPMVAIAKQKARQSRGKYECAKCRGLFSISSTQIDHIVPIVDPIEGYKDLDTFVTRLFCDDSNLQILCVDCHKIKTQQENSIRILNRSKK